MRKSIHGFTLVETLMVIGLVLVLSAILYPVLARSRAAAKKTASIGHMRQFAVALSLYRAEYEPGASGQDDIVSKGFPPLELDLIKWAHFPPEVWHTGGYYGPDLPDVYTWMIPPPGQDRSKPSWHDYYEKVGEQAVFMLDETQGNEPDPKFHFMRVHTILAAHLDGHVDQRTAPGDYGSYQFWMDGN